MKNLFVLGALVFAVGCNCGGEAVIGGGGGKDGGTGGGAPEAGPDGGTDAGTTALDAGCSGGLGLQCRIATNCPAGSPTKLTGVVNIPAGTLPLHNALVYIPNAALAPIPTGASCDLCETAPSGAPLVQAKTDTEGKFELVNVPTGAKVPLVVQVGKWRREVEIASVPACQTTQLSADATRLPRSSTEGHVPKIAIATGGADTLECLLKKVGVSVDEFTPESGSGRVNLFAGYGGASAYASSVNGGAAYSGTPALWNTLNVLKGYDLLLLGCEGNTPDPNKSPSAAAEMQKYLHLGGRVFGTHLHQYWVAQAPAPFPSVATFGNHPDLPSPYTADVDTGFPRGAELAKWLVNVGASQTSGKIDINAGQHSIESVNPAVATKWISGTNPTTVQYFSFKAPIGVPAAQQCGRFVLTDIHVSSGDAQAAFPSGCTTTAISPQEKVLIYMMFDLSNCVSAEIN